MYSLLIMYSDHHVKPMKRHNFLEKEEKLSLLLYTLDKLYFTHLV